MLSTSSIFTYELRFIICYQNDGRIVEIHADNDPDSMELKVIVSSDDPEQG